MPRTRESIASCSNYAVELRPSPRNRLGLMAGHWFLFWFGALLVAHTPAPGLLRSSLVVGWLCASLHGLKRQAGAFGRVSRLTVGPDGRVALGGPDGSILEARLASGSRLIGRYAWLRIRFPDGRVCGECLGAADAGAENWRRFSLLWQYGRLFE